MVLVPRPLDLHQQVRKLLFPFSLVLATLGTVWLSVRGQHPYQGPGASALLIVAAFVIINYTATVAVRRRATAGVSGKSRFTPAEIAVLAAAWNG